MSNLFALYESIRQRIIGMQLTEDDIGSLKDVFEDATIVERRSKKCLSYCGQTTSGNILNIYKVLDFNKLYRDFISTRPKSSVIYDYLLATYDTMLTRLKQANSPGNVLAWTWADHARACINAYRCYEETEYLDLLVQGFELALKYRDIHLNKEDFYKKRIVNTWGYQRNVDSPWITEVTLPGRILAPVLEYCLLVAENDALKSKYEDVSNEFLEYCLEIINEFVHEMNFNSEGCGWFTNPLLGDHEPMNHQAVFAKSCALAYALTKDGRYKTIVEGFTRYFFSQVLLEDNSYSWAYRIISNEEYVPSKKRTSKFLKEGHTVDALVEIYNQNFKIKWRDRARLKNTFLYNVHRGASSFNWEISRNVENPYSGQSNAERNYTSAPRLLSWVVLDQFDEKVREIIKNAVSHRIDLFPLGWFGTEADAASFLYILAKEKDQ